MAEKISEQTQTTTPAKSDSLVVVTGSGTRKTTIHDAVDSVLGWFDVGHNGADQTGINDVTETQLLCDAASANQGGYTNLPHGISSGDVYDSGNSRIKLGWLAEGQACNLRVTGDFTTGVNNTEVTLTFKFFDSSDVEIFSLSDSRYYKDSGTHPAMIDLPFWVSSTLASDGYIQAYVTFDGGGSNEVDMGGFFVSVLS